MKCLGLRYPTFDFRPGLKRACGLDLGVSISAVAVPHGMMPSVAFRIEPDLWCKSRMGSQVQFAHLAKTLSFLLPVFRAAAPPSKSSKSLLSPFQRCSHRALFPWPPLRQAALRSIPQRAITAVRSESSSLKGPATARETVPALLSRTDSEFAVRNCDHLRRPRCALGHSDPHSHSESRTRRCGCADHHIDS